MKFKDLKKSLQQEIYPCYILTCGNDEEDLFLKGSCKNNLLKASVNSFAELNTTIFSTENIDAVSLKNALETLPFMAEKRLVLIKEVEGKKNEKVIEVLKNYLLNPNPQTVLVIDECENTSFKTIENLENATVVDCSRVERELVMNFALKTCKEKGVSITASALNKLIDYCDGYLIKVNLELDKLINYKLDEKQIVEQDIDGFVTKSEEYQIFELTNALILKQGDKALYIVDDIIKNKKNINMILNLIYNHIRRLFYVKISKDDFKTTASLLDVKEFAVKKLSEQAKNISAKKLKEVLQKCLETDYNIKSGNLDLISGIYNLVFLILV